MAEGKSSNARVWLFAEGGHLGTKKAHTKAFTNVHLEMKH
jgi:hypothetical protein